MLKKEQSGERFHILAGVRNRALINVLHGSLWPDQLDVIYITLDPLLVLGAELVQRIAILFLSVQACFAFCEPNVSDNVKTRDGLL